jgi:hydrogenase maturation protease
MRAIVIGVGNPLLGDDGVGIRVARELSRRFDNHAGVTVTELYAGGLRLMEAMVGFDRALVIDAMVSGSCPPGSVRCFAPEELGATRNLRCAHDTSLPAALAMGEMLGLPLPEEIRVWGVEAGCCEEFGEELTAPVEKAVPGLVEELVRQLEGAG